MIVHKFGGTSVGDAERIGNVAGIIQKAYREQENALNPGTVVVVSAMSGVTDQLIRSARAAARGEDSLYREIKASLLKRHLEVVENLLAQSPARLEMGGAIEDKLNELERFLRSIAMLGELTPRGQDAVVSFGEILSSKILAALLRQRGSPSEAVSATTLIVTDDHYGEAGLLFPKTRENLQACLTPLIDRGVIPVVTGFIGATADGVTTTLGRGGSDYSAAIIGAGLEADEVWIWSDVDGILTADPNIVPQARTLDQLYYKEAAELAYYGADVLHPRTIRPVIENRIPLRILNSFNPEHPGTLILPSAEADRPNFSAIISTTGLSLMAVSGQDDIWSLALAARILQNLSGAGLQVLMFSQSFSEHSLNLVVSAQDQTHCLRVLTQDFGLNCGSEPCQIKIKEQIGTVSVVGLSSGEKNSAVSWAYAALGKSGAQVIAVAQPASEHSVSFCIPEGQVPETVRLLHQELGLGN
jgi:aspartokinase/homoserine dehydrogenase 1